MHCAECMTNILYDFEPNKLSPRVLDCGIFSLTMRRIGMRPTSYELSLVDRCSSLHPTPRGNSTYNRSGVRFLHA